MGFRCPKKWGETSHSAQGLYRILYNKLIEELNEIKPPALATEANVEENTAKKPALYSPTEPILLWVKSYQIHSSY